MLVDGRAIATAILLETRSSMPRVAIVRAITIAPNRATESYLKLKGARAQDAGMSLEVVELPETVTEEEVIAEILREGADAIIVQLPLPAHIDSVRVCNSIPAGKDADVLSVNGYAAFLSGEGVVPPVAAAMQEVFERHQVQVSGARAVVVGQGQLVGQPCAALLEKLGAEVSVITRNEGDLSLLKDAAIVVLGAGVPGLVRAEHLSPGVVIIDAGTSEHGGALVGDAHPDCAEVASVYTPVPGGVGPIAVACLFRNVLHLLTRPLREDKKRVD